eukprot:355041-Chlamydomonas_euryale.AAC.14
MAFPPRNAAATRDEAHVVHVYGGTSDTVMRGHHAPSGWLRRVLQERAGRGPSMCVGGRACARHRTGHSSVAHRRPRGEQPLWIGGGHAVHGHAVRLVRKVLVVVVVVLLLLRLLLVQLVLLHGRRPLIRLVGQRTARLVAGGQRVQPLSYAP